ncbi:hypothetical protein E3P81_04111 [Wallemia ichthyophaga]|nr:hypothetical protein E3P97_04120 [Wallemia ichthyophaga]TIB27700.1 hypothetical protein E3P85_04118 [Wallemia ichthyophaga]TIB42829.1 hypothetical protein E3P82_04119 [Wallemia ichthyophaga]TIB45121.1 hypothetical protein E3P81_04111 [Wallemia ichthyophaga]TIB46783.1 hypothetical protein E3P80_04124 [Wallemia ichthyophaga]
MEICLKYHSQPYSFVTNDSCCQCQRNYSRHAPTKAFGLIFNSPSNVHYQTSTKLAYLPALEDVLVWDIKSATLQSEWHETGCTAQVTQLSPNPANNSFAVGYSDGSIRIWQNNAANITFNGHKSPITSLEWDLEGIRLISGSKDTNIIVWDTLAEQGLTRLKGHKDAINTLHFISQNHLISTSNDTFIKLWDLNTQHCLQTLIGHRSPVTTSTLTSDLSLLASGSSDGEIRLWSINHENLHEGLSQDDNGDFIKFINHISTLPTHTINRKRISQLAFHDSLPFLAILSSDRSLEVLRLRTEEEIKSKMARRRRRNKDKGKATHDDSSVINVTMNDRLTPYLVVHSHSKIKSFSFPPLPSNFDPKAPAQVLLALANNAVELHAIPAPTKKTADEREPEAYRLHSLDLPGHRADIRALALSSDDQLLASASNGQLKVWNMKTQACLRTIDCGYAISVAFLPGNRSIVIGTKSGNLQLYDLISSTQIADVDAHDNTIYAIDIAPSKTSLVTASGDKDVKFWDITEVERDSDVVENQKVKSVGIVHTRTLKMTDEVLAVKHSPDNRYIAVSLLDSTVKIFFNDSLKFYLSLYGHKLPVLSMDISHDSKLIITSSADKNIKIWGLDFGDCRKSLFGHDSSVMQVQFEADSHRFWSTSKDTTVAYWDGDKFEQIQKLYGHQGEIWALVTSKDGQFLVTGSHDKSLRVWEKLDEPLFLEEEREKALEELYEADLADEDVGKDQNDQVEADNVHKATSETLMAGEKIIEAIEISDEDINALNDYNNLSQVDKDKVGGPPTRHAQFVALGNPTPDEYLLKFVLEKISPPDLHDALLVLPFSHVISLLRYLETWSEKGWNIGLVARILFFLLKTHHHQIVANRVMRNTMIGLKESLRKRLNEQKSVVGFNLAALKVIRRAHDADRIAKYLEEEDMDEERANQRLKAEEEALMNAGKKRKRIIL